MTLGDLFELVRFLEHLRQACSSSHLTEASDTCTPSIVTINEQIEAAMERMSRYEALHQK
jgi:hypothetical protein